MSAGIGLPTVAVASVLLIALTTIFHYEVLSTLSAALPTLTMPKRAKVLVTIFCALAAHALEIGLYGLAIYLLGRDLQGGALAGQLPFTLEHCLYFSAETYTSLGLGDVTPTGSLRLLAGVEALNGLLLIGWSASFAHLEMDRFWRPERHDVRR